MGFFLNELKNKQNKLVRRYITKTERTIVVARKPLSIWTVRNALIQNKVIRDDGSRPDDIVDINQPAIWDNFRAIYEKNERKNVRNGYFTFYIEENSVLSQVYDVSPKQFEVVLGEICSHLGCSLKIEQEIREELPNMVLHKATVKHNGFSRDLTAFFKSVAD